MARHYWFTIFISVTWLTMTFRTQNVVAGSSGVGGMWSSLLLRGTHPLQEGWGRQTMLWFSWWHYYNMFEENTLCQFQGMVEVCMSEMKKEWTYAWTAWSRPRPLVHRVHSSESWPPPWSASLPVRLPLPASASPSAIAVSSLMTVWVQATGLIPAWSMCELSPRPQMSSPSPPQRYRLVHCVLSLCGKTT